MSDATKGNVFSLHSNSDAKQWETISAAIDTTKTCKDGNLLTQKPVLNAILALSTEEQRKEAESQIIDIARKKLCITEVKAILKNNRREYAQRLRIEKSANKTAFSTLPTGITQQLNCGKFLADDDGIVYQDVKDDGIPYVIPVCNRAILPVEYIINLENQTCMVKIAYFDERWKTITVERSKLATRQAMAQALSDLRTGVNSENASYLIKYFDICETQNEEFIPKSKSVSRLGWTDEGFSPYIKELQFTGDANFKVLFNAVSEKGLFANWLMCMEDVRKKSIAARLYLAASFAAPLVKYFDGLSFVVHLKAKSGYGKSVALMAAASVWGNPGDGGIIRTFDSTQVGMEMLAGFFKNLPICLDEMETVKTDIWTQSKFDDTIYKLCQGQGRSRGAAGGGIRDTPTWKTIFLTNGEHDFTNSESKAGAKNRVIEIYSNEKIFDDFNYVLDTINSNYGAPGKVFIERLQASDYDELTERFQATKKRMNEAASDSTGKLQAAGAYLLFGDELASEWIFQDAPLSAAIVAEHLGKEIDIMNFKRIWRWVINLIAENANKFGIDGQTDNTTWGKRMGSGNIAILPKILRAEMKKVGYNYETFLRDADEQNLLEKPKSNEKEKVVTINRISTRCIILKVADYEDDMPWNL